MKSAKTDRKAASKKKAAASKLRKAAPKRDRSLSFESDLLRTLIDHLPDRIYVKDLQGRKTISNIADWHASGGKRMEDVIGKSDFDTYPAEFALKHWAD